MLNTAADTRKTSVIHDDGSFGIIYSRACQWIDQTKNQYPPINKRYISNATQKLILSL